MAHTAQGCCTQENFCHAVKGTGYFFGMAGTSCALLAVAATVTAVAVGLLAWDGLFVYSAALRAPIHLLWAIPVTLAFIAIDLLIIINIGKIALAVCAILTNKIQQYSARMMEHYRTISL